MPWTPHFAATSIPPPIALMDMGRGCLQFPGPISRIPPAEAEANFYLQQCELAMAA